MEIAGGRSSPTSHFLLVHGAAHGAWCWYKTITLLEQSGHRATALDLRSCGRDSTDPENITTLAALAEPVVRFLDALPAHEKVILVGHSFGGAVITLLMEQFPEKIAVAVFVSARMLPSGDAGEEITSKVLALLGDKLSLTKISASIYTGVFPPGLPELYYHLTSAEDVSLAKLSLKPFPTLSRAEMQVPHTRAKYGSVPRVFIRCLKDLLFTAEVVDLWIQSNPPAQVFRLDCDHSPFFSATAELHQCFLQIAATYG